MYFGLVSVIHNRYRRGAVFISTWKLPIRNQICSDRTLTKIVDWSFLGWANTKAYHSSKGILIRNCDRTVGLPNRFIFFVNCRFNWGRRELCGRMPQCAPVALDSGRATAHWGRGRRGDEGTVIWFTYESLAGGILPELCRLAGESM